MKRNRIVQKMQKMQKMQKRGALLLVLALIAAVPVAVAVGLPSIALAAPEDNMVLEYRYLEGEEDQVVIAQTINRFGREYRLISQTDPVEEGTLPLTRTYTTRISGTLSEEDLERIEDLEGVEVSPVKEAVEREVDKTEVIENLPNNDVEYLPLSKEFEVASANSPDMITANELQRAGVSYEITGYDEDGLPSSYRATIVYRGVETYERTLYHVAKTTYTSTVTVGEVTRYIVTATYEPTDLEEGSPIVQTPGTTPAGTAPADSEGMPNEPGTVVIADSADDQGVPTEEIEDTEVPLSEGLPTEPAWALLNLILVLLGVLLAAGAAVAKTLRDRRTEECGERVNSHRQRETLGFAATVLLAAGGVAVFLLTEDMGRLTVLTDAWTVVHEFILIVEIAAAVLVFLRNKDRSGKSRPAKNEG